MLHLNLIETRDEVQALCDRIRAEPFIGVDTEFIRERTFYPVISLIQLASARDAWLIDAQTLTKEDLAPLFDILSAPKILKIFHAAQGDQECLYTHFGVLASPCLDTAIAAALCGYGDQMGLGALLHDVLGVSIKKGQARTYWDKRPLPDTLKKYALADVAHLVALARALLGELDQLRRRDWAMGLCQECASPQLYDVSAHDLAERLVRSGRFDARAYAILIALMEWRETYCRRHNIVRKRVAGDDVIMDLVRSCPESIEDLRSFRGLDAKVIKDSATTILAAIQHGMTCKTLPELPKKALRRTPHQRTSEFLLCALRTLADQHRVAVRYLATAEALETLLSASLKEKEELAGYFSPWAYQLIGDAVWELLHGRIVLVIREKRVTFETRSV